MNINLDFHLFLSLYSFFAKLMMMNFIFHFFSKSFLLICFKCKVTPKNPRSVPFIWCYAQYRALRAPHDFHADWSSDAARCGRIDIFQEVLLVLSHVCGHVHASILDHDVPNFKTARCCG